MRKIRNPKSETNSKFQQREKGGKRAGGGSSRHAMELEALDLLEAQQVVNTVGELQAGRVAGHADASLIERFHAAAHLREDPGRYWAGRMPGGEWADRTAGVVWHTQGSGKSFTMLFFAARVVRHPAMQNPTIMVLTDRNNLDDQLFGQMPVQARDREHLRELLPVRVGAKILAAGLACLPAPG